MKQLLLLLFCLSCLNLFSQNPIEGDCTGDYNIPVGGDASSLVEILVGEGVEFDNAVLTQGFDCSTGYFTSTNAATGIEIESGIVMSTMGVDFDPFLGDGGPPGSLESDLTLQLDQVNAINSNMLNNIIVLEFDFRPISDQVSFQYVFGSEEYQNYTCSQYNDIFGFFISGPGINGIYENNAVNIALIPDPNNPGEFTNTPVIINALNGGVPTGFDMNPQPCADIDPNWEDYAVFFSENSAVDNIAVDPNFPFHGFTVPLTATYQVIPCEWHHIKLAIADVTDGGVNSGVFLQEGSFSSPPINQIEVESNVVNVFNSSSEFIDNLYEGCGSASVTFYRPEGIVGEVVFPFETSGSATNLVDFEFPNAENNELVMPAGLDSITLQVVPFGDQVLEPTEQLILEILPVTYDCYQTLRDTIIFEIFDQPILEFEYVSPDFLLDCPGDEANLTAQAFGGIASLMEQPDYVYQWSEQPNQDQNVTVSPVIPTDYFITVTDVCGQFISDNVFVDFLPYEELILNSEIVYTCFDQLEEVCIETQGGNPPFTFLWENGEVDSCMQDYPDIYEVSVIDECAIENTFLGQIILDEAPDPAFSVYQMPDDNLGIDINNSTFALDGLSYLWDFGDNTGSIVEDPESHYYPESGEYNVTLGVTTEINNCYKELSQVVQIAPLYYYYSPNSFTPNGDMMNDNFIPSLVGVENFELFIYDRWGKQVFYSNDFNNQWDGTFESNEAQSGTYNFKVLVKKYYDDTIYQEYGIVTLLR